MAASFATHRRNTFTRLYPLQARVSGVFIRCFYIHVLLLYAWLKRGNGQVPRSEVYFGVLCAASVSIRCFHHTILRSEMTVAAANAPVLTVVSIIPCPGFDGETMHFTASNQGGDDIGPIEIAASEPAKSLVLKVLECIGGCVRELRQAPDGVFYDFEEFVEWYNLELATKRWNTATVNLRKEEQIALLFDGSHRVTQRLLACPLWSFPRVDRNTSAREFKVTCLWGAIADALGTRAMAYALRMARENRFAGRRSLFHFECTYAGEPRRASGAMLQPGSKGMVVLFQRSRPWDSYYCTFVGMADVILVPLKFISWARFCTYDLNDGDEILYVGPPRTGPPRADGKAPFFLKLGTKGTAIAEAPSQSFDIQVRFPRIGTVALLDEEVRFHAALGALEPVAKALKR